MVYLTSLVTFSVIFAAAYGLCSWPCYWQNNDWYNNKFDWYLSFATSSYEVYFNGTVIINAECLQRYGPFIMIRFPDFGTHSCVKLVHYADDLFVSHGLSFPPTVPPVLCDLCSSIEVTNDSLTVWVATELTELGCDTPKNCPSGYGDTPCTGCEKGVPDNGYCCNDKPETHKESYTTRTANKGYVKRPSKYSDMYNGEKKTYGGYGAEKGSGGYGHYQPRPMDSYNPSNP